jgi:AcrR family transcriptional regulator
VSGVTSTSICLHFADKDALPDAVCAGYFEKLDAEMQPWCQDRLPHEGARRASICSWMSGDIGVDAVDPAEHVRGQELVMDAGEMPVERSAQLVLVLLYLHRRRLKVRIHGRPRSDRKKRFLLSAVAPSTSARHPREAKPINWAQRGGLASGGKLST